MRIANRRHEAVDEQRWFGAPCLIRDLEPKPLSVRAIDVAAKRINAVPKASGGERMLIDRN